MWGRLQGIGRGSLEGVFCVLLSFGRGWFGSTGSGRIHCVRLFFAWRDGEDFNVCVSDEGSQFNVYVEGVAVGKLR